MTGSLLAIIVTPIVCAIALAVWLSALFWASRHPQGSDSGIRPKRSVYGPVFRGDGRQLKPHRDAVPPEAVAWDARVQARGQTDAAGPMADTRDETTRGQEAAARPGGGRQVP
jgi:hypothetical protein